MTASSDLTQQRWRWRRRGVSHPKAGTEDLPESMHCGGNHAWGQAYEAKDAGLARRPLQQLAGLLQQRHPNAAACARVWRIR